MVAQKVNFAIEMLRLLKVQNTPRWVVFFLDMTICLMSLFISYALIVVNIDFESNLPQMCYLLCISAIVHFMTKVYGGTVRRTALKDFVRVFVTRLLVSGVVLLVCFLTKNFVVLQIPYRIIVVDFSISSLGLFTLRVFVKWIFNQYSAASDFKYESIAILGSNNDDSFSILQALNSRFDIKAFIVDKPLSYKRIAGIRIMTTEEAQRLLVETKKITKLVTPTTIKLEPGAYKFLNHALNCGIQLSKLPNLAEITSGKSSSETLKSMNIEDLLGRSSIVLETQAVSNAIFGKCILVTGAAGSIGSEIARQVLGYWPSKLILLDSAETPLFHLSNELNQRKKFSTIPLEFIIADVRNEVDIESVFANHQIDFVYHAAAYKHVPLMEANPEQAIKTNVLGSINVARAAAKFGSQKFVQVSTDKAVNPTNVMGASKRAAEIYLQLIGSETELKVITTRFGNVLGSNGSVVPTFQEQLERGGPLTVTHPDIERYFMTIPEACSLVLEAGTMGIGGEIYVFDMGEPVKILQMAENFIRLNGKVPYQEVDIIFTGLRPGEKLYEEVLASSELTLKTANNKILRAKHNVIEMESIKIKFDELFSLTKRSADINTLIGILKEIIPEYTSNNSPFELLDFDKRKIDIKKDVNFVHGNTYILGIKKRAFDLVFSLLILPFALIIFVLVFLVYPFFGGFRFFYKQKRMGLNGKMFSIYKIRTLRMGHNNIRAGMSKNDGTVLGSLGVFLRKTRIDELPQILNILKGEMSWVGPRPEQEDVAQSLLRDNMRYQFRHLARPGITGLAQIYKPSATLDDVEVKLNKDLTYIKKANLFLDLYILAKSLIVIREDYI